MLHCKVHVKQTNKLRVHLDDFLDALACVCLIAETALDVVKNFSMGGVRLVEEVAKRDVGRTETICEMLGEDPAAVLHIQMSILKCQ